MSTVTKKPTTTPKENANQNLSFDARLKAAQVIDTNSFADLLQSDAPNLSLKGEIVKTELTYDLDKNCTGKWIYISLEEPLLNVRGTSKVSVDLPTLPEVYNIRVHSKELKDSGAIIKGNSKTNETFFEFQGNSLKVDIGMKKEKTEDGKIKEIPEVTLCKEYYKDFKGNKLERVKGESAEDIIKRVSARRGLLTPAQAEN